MDLQTGGPAGRVIKFPTLRRWGNVCHALVWPITLYRRLTATGTPSELTDDIYEYSKLGGDCGSDCTEIVSE